jgi:hypothetical protein
LSGSRSSWWSFPPRKSTNGFRIEVDPSSRRDEGQ